ncbi:alpha/beta hydrolase [Flavobacterium ovatum]|uniref:RBBP9/YdeN family alpha/beta hydrolase n=1 Tax=Flavobacterium ovatum TaxID=1928857 RepID=UPI00344CC44B
MQPHLLIIPGLGGSGVNHWQRLWHKKYPNSNMVEQEDWEKPILDKWLAKLNESIQELQQPTILVGHSLGAILITLWANQFQNKNIVGALLVAPADVDSSEHTPDILWNFAPIPFNKLTFPSLVITSTNDPYVSTERAEFLSKSWGSQFTTIGPKGHINSESNLGIWEEGQDYLKSFVENL